MPFTLFDPELDVRVTAGNLPHWFQFGATYFITFRTADSIPTTVADQWHRERDEWFVRHGIRAQDGEWAEQEGRIPLDLRKEYSQLFPQRFLDYLDQGAGACLLREPVVARIVADTLRHFDGDRYDLGDFVVMPNHVHVLVGLRHETDMVRLCYSWKRYSAGEINKTLGRSGRFWQEESFDHLVGTAEQFEYFRGYIARNPGRAGLRAGEYLLFRADEERHAERAYYIEGVSR
jgi:putative transposase